MTNYKNGKVYKIECINGEEGDTYIGSTTKQYLSQRMVKHRTSYRAWKESKTNYVSAYDLFDKYGVENCSIMLLESCPCDSKDMLHAREGFFIRSLRCVNKRIEGRTDAEWRKDNEEIIKQKKHDYHLNNKEVLNAISREYQKNHAEELKDSSHQYYEKNKAEIREKQIVYNKNNAEAIKAYKKQWYQDNKNKEKEIKYRKDNSEKIKAQRKQWYENKKVKEGLDV